MQEELRYDRDDTVLPGLRPHFVRRKNDPLLALFLSSYERLLSEAAVVGFGGNGRGGGMNKVQAASMRPETSNKFCEKATNTQSVSNLN